MPENIDKFIDALRGSLSRETFIKLTLGNYKGADEHLQKIQIRLINTKKGSRLYFLYRSDTRDTAKNYGYEEGIGVVRRLLETEFRAAHLFTTEHDYQLDIGGKGRSRLNVGRPTFRTRISTAHDREKHRWVDQSAFYLNALGITNNEGKVRDRSQDKWRQINRFVEIVAGLVERSPLLGSDRLRIVDMGSGKGYLTFALYDHFKNIRGMNVHMTGVDLRDELVSLGNDIAGASEFDDLRFVRGSIEGHEVGETDILIALHACNTATDEAIYKGILSDARIVVVAPCCHQELRPQIESPAMLKDVLKHGVMLERTAEFVTDAMRTLLLERSGYSTRLIEFVPVEHTPKNLMIVGTKRDGPLRTDEIDAELADIKRFYSVREQRLDRLVSSGTAAANL